MAGTAASAGSLPSSKHTSGWNGNGNGNGRDGPQEPSTLYKLVMTPINFASFILSLVLVDMQYSLRRVHSHAEAPSRLPSWLHSLLFCPQPYYQPARYGKDAVPGGGGSRGSSSEPYYHSNQRRLMEMEAEEAFRMRNTVLIVFGLVVAGAAGAVWFFATRLYRYWFV